MDEHLSYLYISFNTLAVAVPGPGGCRVASITDFSIEVRNSENDPYFSRFLFGVLKFSDFLRIVQFFDFFQHFLL